MILLLLGAPGSGKGTQAKSLVANLSIPQFSTGEMLRKAVSDKTSLGIQAESFMKSGQLVPDTLVLGLLEQRINSSESKNGFILDGFPRNLTQAAMLADVLKKYSLQINHVISMNVNEAALVKRLTGRRVCLKCGAGYHIDFQPPANVGICDKCGSHLTQRDDDQEQVIKNRLEVFNEQTLPLLDYYKKISTVNIINGSETPSDVTKSIMKIVGSN